MASPDPRIDLRSTRVVTIFVPPETPSPPPRLTQAELQEVAAECGLYRTQLEPRIPEERFPAATNEDPHQEDLPHLIGHRLEDRCPPPESTHRPAMGFQYGPACFPPHPRGRVDEVVVCDPPSRLNTGAHRVIAEGEFAGEPFIAIVEEMENWRCGFVGEVVYLGMGRHTAVEDDPEAFLQFLTRATTGIGLYLRSHMRSRAPGGIRIAFFPYTDVQGDKDRWRCVLSVAADRCLLYPKERQRVRNGTGDALRMIVEQNRKVRRLSLSGLHTWRGPDRY